MIKKNTRQDVKEIIYDKMLELTINYSDKTQKEINEIIEKWNKNHFNDEQIYIPILTKADYI